MPAPIDHRASVSAHPSAAWPELDWDLFGGLRVGFTTPKRPAAIWLWSRMPPRDELAIREAIGEEKGR